MAWAEVVWESQEIISLGKMTQINDNALENRKQATYEMIINNPIFEEDNWIGSLTDVDVWLEIDGTRYGSINHFSGDAIGSGSEDDIDISTVLNGIHTIRFHFESNGGTLEVNTRTFIFLKTDTNDYLTWWFTYSTAGSGVQFTKGEVLLHQEIENLAP